MLSTRFRPPLPRLAAIILFGCIALMGGGSRADALSQGPLRLIAIAVIAVLVTSRYRPDGGFFRSAAMFLLAAGALALIQLAPLPPAIWQALPGRALYTEAAAAAGVPQPWRPLNLTPDLGWNSVFSLWPALGTLCVLAYLRSDDRGLVLNLFLATVGLSALLSFVQLAQGEGSPLRLYESAGPQDAVGLFANRNHNALLMAVALPLLPVWAMMAKHRLPAAVALALFCVLGIVMTGSRAGMIAGLLGAGAAGLMWRSYQDPLNRHATPHRRRQKLLLALGVSIAAAMLVAMLLIGPEIGLRRSLVSADDPRVGLLAPTFRMLVTFFPVGSGFGSFAAVYRHFEPFENLRLTYMNQAHDDLLQIGIEAGIPGLILLATFVCWWGRTSFRLWQTIGANDEGRVLGRAGSVGVALILFGSSVDYPVRTPIIAALLITCCCWMAQGLIAPPPSDEDRHDPGFTPPGNGSRATSSLVRASFR